MHATTTPQTLGQFLQAKAERCPDTVVPRFVHGGRPDDVITYARLVTNAHKLAITLHRQGITQGVTFGVILSMLSWPHRCSELYWCPSIHGRAGRPRSA